MGMSEQACKQGGPATAYTNRDASQSGNSTPRDPPPAQYTHAAASGESSAFNMQPPAPPPKQTSKVRPNVLFLTFAELT